MKYKKSYSFLNLCNKWAQCKEYNMHAEEHNATENKSMISPQICAFSIPTPSQGDWLIQYFKTMQVKQVVFLYV